MGFDEKRAEIVMIMTIEKEDIKCVLIPKSTIFNDKTIAEILAGENGIQMAIDTVRNTLSVPVHYYAKMDFEAIREIIDCAGGIELEGTTKISYDDPQNNMHIRLTEGV